MVVPNLEVLNLQPNGHVTPRSEALFAEIARTLHVHPSVAIQMAATHTLHALQRLEPLNLVLPFSDPAADHKPGSHDV